MMSMLVILTRGDEDAGTGDALLARRARVGLAGVEEVARAVAAALHAVVRHAVHVVSIADHPRAAGRRGC